MPISLACPVAAMHTHGVTGGGADALERFYCEACGTPLTRTVARLPAVPEPRPEVDYGGTTEPTVPEGHWAFDSEPAGWAPREQSQLDPDEQPGDVTKWRPHGLWNCPILNVSDLLALTPHPDGLRSGGCCGRDGSDGPNVVCPSCGLPVGTVSDDCWTAQEVRLDPGSVVARPVA